MLIRVVDDAISIVARSVIHTDATDSHETLAWRRVQVLLEFSLRVQYRVHSAANVESMARQERHQLQISCSRRKTPLLQKKLAYARAVGYDAVTAKGLVSSPDIILWNNS